MSEPSMCAGTGKQVHVSVGMRGNLLSSIQRFEEDNKRLCKNHTSASAELEERANTLRSRRMTWVRQVSGN